MRLDQFLKSHGVKWTSLHRSLRNRYYYVIDVENNTIKDAGYRLSQNDRLFYPNNS
jgi:hypothetical protein